MHIKPTNGLLGKKDITYPAILLAAALCIGIYLIVTAVLISKDGVTFIEYAKNLALSPKDTMLNGYQHPGYPFLISAVHRIINITRNCREPYDWIYSAQITALVFRLFALAMLYFLGKVLTGRGHSFFAVLILVFLPKPAEYGSDALSDWPHLFFLMTGILLLIGGAIKRQWWSFGLAGLLSGIGYLIRPECAQLVVLGLLWLGFQFFWPKRTMTKGKAVFASILLLAGFLIIAGPYMKLKGAVFPKKHIGEFASTQQQFQPDNTVTESAPDAVYKTYFTAKNIGKSLVELIQNAGDTLMWFFVPALLTGLYLFWQKQEWHEPQKFFITTFIALNILVMIWLYCKHGYMSERHTLPMMAIIFFYIPHGLQAISNWLCEKFPEKIRQSSANGNRRLFVILFIIGISICIPKLLTPLHYDKKCYKAAAQWIAQNTDKTAVIAVPDIRISFYAQRPGISYEGQTIPENSQYTVRKFNTKKQASAEKTALNENVVFSCGDKKSEIVVYNNAPH
ncbi:MAG: glycosyltransferase family 39 protein [Planctomycetota bacterium]|nr:glycosyltransferase family 39 protein [Planctomycetota bacterium]